MTNGICGARVENLEPLVEGDFPSDLASLFTRHGTGLFHTEGDSIFLQLPEQRTDVHTDRIIDDRNVEELFGRL